MKGKSLPTYSIEKEMSHKNDNDDDDDKEDAPTCIQREVTRSFWRGQGTRG